MNKKGFTLVELLAVIAILALLVIIALPNVLSMFNSAKKDIFLTQAKNVYKEVSKKYISETMKGNKITKISSKDNKLDIESNDMEYNIILDDKGNVKKFQVSDGTYCLSGNFSNLSEFTSDKISEGECENMNDNSPEAVYCTFDGSLEQGATYVNGQYTYMYKFKGVSSSSKWNITSYDGWGVQLTDKTSTEPVTSKLCTYINDKPVVSMSYMFGNSKATSIDLSSFNTSNIIDMSEMFYGSQATTLNFSSFNTSNVKYMSSMFKNSQATTLDLSNFDTSKVTSMFSMFSSSKATSINMSSFNTSNVTDMSWMFYISSATTLDVSSFDTSNADNMMYMFANFLGATLDVSNFNTSNVKNMGYMFYNSKLKAIDLSSFDTSKVTNMNYMFASNIGIKTIYISDKFTTDAVTKSDNMFIFCDSLVGGAGTVYDLNKRDKSYARIDGGTSSPGYFTKK